MGINTEMSTEMKNQIIDHIQNSGLSDSTKSIGSIGVLLGMNPDLIIRSMVATEDHIQHQVQESNFPARPKAKGYTKTQSIIVDMLTENTGAAMMDSGGIYGRHWQQNRSIGDFRQIPEIKIETNEWHGKREFSIHKSLFHYLNRHLKYDGMMTAKLKRFANTKEWKNESWIATIEAFVEEKLGMKIEINDNTYNRENLLDQDFQYHIFEYGDTSYCILQTHNGCDIRGGYSEPKVFECIDWQSFVLGISDISGSCGCIDAYSDNAGYHWYGYYNERENKSQLPQEWSVSTRLHGLFCRECKQRVDFS